MTEREKLELTRRHMEMAQMEYRQLVRMLDDATPSLGMVMKWDRVGGFSAKVSSPTERLALMRAGMGEAIREKLKWIEAIYEAFFQLIDGAAKEGARLVHDRNVAEVIRLSVFEGHNQATIADAIQGPNGSVNKQYVSRLYGDAVALVMECAERRGLFEDRAN